jgi:hypothetical protein
MTENVENKYNSFPHIRKDQCQIGNGIGIIWWAVLRIGKEEYYKRIQEREKMLLRRLQKRKKLPKFSPNGEIARLLKKQKVKKFSELWAKFFTELWSFCLLSRVLCLVV